MTSETFIQEPVFRRLGEVARYAALSKADQEAYKASLKAYRDSYAIMKTERDEGRAEGVLIGEARGMQIGEARGMQIGEVRGRQSEKEAMARRLKESGSDLDFISMITELPIERIKELRILGADCTGSFPPTIHTYDNRDIHTGAGLYAVNNERDESTRILWMFYLQIRAIGVIFAGLNP